MDPALAEFWTTTIPARDYAATALAEARKANENEEHPHALRYVLGLREGWQEALAASGERAAPNQQGDATEAGEQEPDKDA